MKETMQKQDKGEKASTEKINNGRRQAVRKLAYTPPTLITLSLIDQASAVSHVSAICPPDPPVGTPGCP